MWILETEHDVDAGPVRFLVAPGELKTIGRAPHAGFVLDAPLVSRLHCRLTATSTTLEIADLDSTNGIFVNDRRVTRAVLTPGDRVGIGRVSLVVKLGDATGDVRPQ